MFTSHRALASLLALALVGSMFVIAPTGASAAGNVYEAEGEILRPNPTPVFGSAHISFQVVCGIPPSQGIDGYVFDLPTEFSGGDAIVEAVGSDATGVHDLDVYFYDSECARIGTQLASEAVDETGPIPAGAEWIVVEAFFGVKTAVSLKATGGGPPEIDLRLDASKEQTSPGQKVTLAGNVSGCTPKKVEIYRDDHRGFFSIGTVEPGEGGAFEMKVAPKVNTTYVAEIGTFDGCKGRRSVERVKVSPKIKVGKMRECDAVAGRVEPNQAGSKITLQRRAKGRWNFVRADRLDRKSRFEMDLPCLGTYRLLWRDAGSHLTRDVRNL